MNFHSEPYTYTGEVHLYVTDLIRSTSFYTEIIGFQILNQLTNKVVFTANGKTPLLIIEQPKDVIAKEPRRTGLYHFALLLPTRADLGKAIIHLAQNNIPLGASDHKVSEAIYFSDPDGNGIEVYVDRRNEDWNWEGGFVEMRTDPLDTESIMKEVNGPWKGLPPETIMGHIHLHVAKLEEAKQFYHALGFNVVGHYPNAIFMSTGNYHHHIALNTWNGEDAPRPSNKSAGLYTFTLVFSVEAILKDALENVKKIGVIVEMTEDSYLVKDPSGNRIILKKDHNPKYSD